MAPQSGQNNGVETFAPDEAKNTLSPTARFVHEVMSKYVMPELTGRGLVATANEIITGKYDATHPTVVDFLVNCRQLEADILTQAKTDGADERTSAVIRNYFTKMIASIKGSAGESL